jgi:hypothetical protein
MRSDQWPQVNSLAPEATSTRGIVQRPSPRESGKIIKERIAPGTQISLTLTKEQILDRFGCKRNKIIDYFG